MTVTSIDIRAGGTTGVLEKICEPFGQFLRGLETATIQLNHAERKQNKPYSSIDPSYSLLTPYSLWFR